MDQPAHITRRLAVKSALFGWIGVSVPNLVFAEKIKLLPAPASGDKIYAGYPALPDELVAELVGLAHFDLEKVKERVEKRPELAKASWDWAYGDFESAIGAASHVGRRDIADYLMLKGARPTIFTFAMYGYYEVVRSMIESMPGIQKTEGPHGISLLRHAEIGARAEGLTSKEKENGKKLVAYLESLGDANGTQYASQTDEEQKKYLGDYRYGDDPADGFTVKVNMRKLLSLGMLGKSGGGLLKLGEHLFTYNGAPSVRVQFAVENNQVTSLTVQEPGLSITARKLSS